MTTRIVLPLILLVLLLGAAACSGPESKPAAAEQPAAATEQQAQAPDQAAANTADGGEADGTASTWTCPMHPEVVSETEGRCPKCTMFLVKQEAQSATETAGAGSEMPHDHAAHDHP